VLQGLYLELEILVKRADPCIADEASHILHLSRYDALS